MTQSTKTTRIERLSKLASHLERGAGDWRAAIADHAVARALHDRFGPAVAEIEATRTLVAEAMAASAGKSRLPAELLHRLHDALADLSLLAAHQPPAPRPGQDPLPLMVIDFQSRARAVELETSTRKILKKLRNALLGLGLAAGLALALPAAAGDVVGGTVIDPNTGSSGVIVKTGTGYVLTDNYWLVFTSLTGLTQQSVTDKVKVKVPVNVNTEQDKYVDATVIGVTINATTHLATSIKVEDKDGNTWDVATFVDKSAGVAPPSTPGGGATTVTLPTASGDKNVVQDVRVAAGGGNGRNGGGFKVFGVVIGVSAGNGGAGTDGQSFQHDVPQSQGLIEVKSDKISGIEIGSEGGAGGRGGDAVFSFGINGGTGGKAGKGGDVTVTNHADITTDGVSSHGMHVFSRSGVGGVAGTVDFGVAQGGSGGEGNGGGHVIGKNYGDITTNKDGAIGLFVQSMGGQSGAGGSSYGFVGIPGSALQAGTGGTAEAYNYGAISTSGKGAHGVSSQSIGGTGGNAGNGIGLATFSLGNDGGGQGGKGGYALAVNGDGGFITTNGKDAYGLVAQSIGGGGGDGGYAGGLVGLGGNGGAGGDGGQAEARLEGNARIVTLGAGSFGVFAQSIGGGGGNGGTGGGLGGVGGKGDGGGNGGGVKVVTGADTSVITTGDSAHAIFAESVGKGGGIGGTGAGVVGIGGEGKGGGDAGEVKVYNDGDLTTIGKGARGIFAQSVGGGGGASSGTGGLVSVGGSAGEGGIGGHVLVENSGKITTGNLNNPLSAEVGSDGIMAQSIGGGGGAGSASGGLVSLGGSGGKGGEGGQVDVTNSGTIDTRGARARGIFAQSIGGGGGSGGDSGGLVSIGGTGGSATLSKGGQVTVTNDGAITTHGAVSSAIQVQSVGGGGGDGGTSGSGLVSIGGSGKGGGNGGLVIVNDSHNLTTTGNDSHGIFAQSVGGGGGNGGSSTSVSAFAGVSVGGKGGLGGEGGNVELHFKDRSVDLGGASPVHVSPLILTKGDRSMGIFAQSVGGGGGNGGFAVQASVGYGVSVAVAVGGKGGDGGKGGLVKLTGDAVVRTEGDFAPAIFAESVGGGGGNGGFSTAISLAGNVEGPAGAFAIGVGGSGGKGGAGDKVTLDMGGGAYTVGAFSTGLLAQSVGGGGGNGGFNLSIAGAGASTTAVGVSVGVGGAGESGGAGGVVDVHYKGDITTAGYSSTGALIQSVGGGGGNGGFNVSASIGIGTMSAGIGVGVGGRGGKGGNADSATGVIDGDIETGLLADPVVPDGTPAGDLKVALDQLKSTQSAGLVVQSVGGGGGNGGFNISGSIGGGLEGNAAVGIGIGGSGGGAGNGGVVHASSHNIVTHANQSPGFLAQSVGGGGGNGGMNISGSIGISGTLSPTISIGLGGAGGGGGDAMYTEGRVTGHVSTYGANSDAITAQSLGGGGGTGGLNVSGGISLSGENSFNLGVSIGGAGGKGGNAGVVDLRINEGVINANHSLLAAYTKGDGSSGVIAQSLGGGGGNGGISVAGGIALSPEAGGNIMVGVGGAGGGSGNADKVTGIINGNVVTEGKDADAVLVQSLGGAGGNGGINVSGGIAATSGGAGNLLVGVGGVGGKGGNAGVVSGTVTGDVQTGWVETVNGEKVRHGDGSSGVTFQSLGGGGGNGGINVTGGIAVSFGDQVAGSIGIGVGGFAGGAGNSSSVTGRVEGDVQTYGDKAYGVLMQSAGGTGGTGGINVTGNIAASAGPSGAIGFGLGGFGGDGGHSVVSPLGDQTYVVRGTTYGDVVTWGKESFGVGLQSMGGGGGVGGMNVTGNISFSTGSTGAGSIGIGIGGFGGKGGSSSGVFGDITGDVQTHGDASKGVFAQSVGGGGGNGAINVTGNITIATGGGATAGGFAFGLGGFGGTGGGSGPVNLFRTGDTETFGRDNSDAIFVQSLAGGGGSGAINVSGDIDLSKGEAGALSVGIGGFGGGGGDAASATAKVTGNVWAHGDGNGVLVQSVGGGGGLGAINVTGQLNLGKTTGRGLAFGLGGFGGNGGDGEKATLTLSGPATAPMAQVVASGDKHAAVTVQSIGGGGGDGGFNITGAIAGDGEIAVGIGGFGGDGGKGRMAEAHVDANLFAAGHAARGLLVQSVGGGGGTGGFNITGAANKSEEFSLAFGLGGFGGDGNISGNVLAQHHGQISVWGLNASGLVAQSVAGGGGDGGLNVAVDLNLEKKGSSLAVGVGGTGGDGANAGTVTVNNVGSIFVNAVAPALGLSVDTLLKSKFDAADSAVKLAENSHALVAQSVGGGGGMGGINITTAIAPKEGKPLALGVGGSGGSGGNGGVVTVTQGWEVVNGVKTAAETGTLRTYGGGSIALLAQSIGGGGGDAGMNVVVPVTYKSDGKDPPMAAVISVGGSGAGAGFADTVTVDHRGNIITGYIDGANGPIRTSTGNDSAGILAQSVGGGGGNANLNIGLGLTRNASALALAVGGATGAAGKGGKVNVFHDGGIFTSGDDASAIIAQSIGGGGGNTSTSIALPALSNDKLEISIGRLGGKGGEGDEVYVDSKGTLDTHGERSSGIFAQSIGGGGGKSGTTAIGGQIKDSTNNETIAGKVTVGLKGGEGAVSKKVEIHAAGFITTDGNDSSAIHAQSIGGGGGVGGLASNSIMRTNASVNVGLGGDGGTGAKAGEVKIYNAAQLTTNGENSNGIFAQSIGGGGGTGGNVATLGIPLGGPKDSTPHMNLALSMGGFGGEAGTGNEVYIENSGVISTTGKQAAGIRAESIGGGGGFGGTVLALRADTAVKSSMTAAFNFGGDGDDGGKANLVTVHNKGGSIWTDGEQAAGISAASIGGGGGEGGGVADFNVAGVSGEKTTYGNITVNMGGSGGKGGKGGEVIVTNTPTAGVAGTGQIVTRKDNSYGIFAQSLGGGGGNGASVFSVTGGKGDKDSVSIGVNIGGSGDTGGTGGNVSVTNSGLIDTTGAGSHGILAQSIGGGGGNGAMVIAGALLIKAPTKSPLIAIGGAGGNGGSSGTVTVVNNGTIVTHGKGAHGIFAQSIGGGGGNSAMGFSLSGNPYTFVGSNALAALIGAFNGGKGGAGGIVDVTNNGTIVTYGEGSYGIVGESINGGGGHLSIDFSSIETLFTLQCIPIPESATCIPGTGGTTGDRPVGQPIYSTTLGSSDVSDMNGGKVTMKNTGTIDIGGKNSVGTAVTSIGGGGGKLDIHALLATTATPANPNTKSSPAAAQNASNTMAATYGITLGSTNGKTSGGGDLDSTQDGDTVTTGRNSIGTLLQSVGGGGGQALLSLEAPAGTQIATVDMDLGATNGTDETGGEVKRVQTGVVVTTDAYSTAVLAQSIGGGGGVARADIDADDQSQLLVRTALGANGGSGLGGGFVNGSYNGLQTGGDHAIALLAQSIGGGGGAALISGSNAADVTLGGKGGANGKGGDITLSNTGPIQTSGVGSHGVLLQSIGGGGGAVLSDATTVNVHLNSGNTGDGGAIGFTQTGSLFTSGAGAYGLIAQSLGGGGGWVDGHFAGSAGGAGKGGAITLTFNGNVLASGAGATAVYAQSTGSQGGGAIAVTANGLVRGNAAGIRIDGGASNTITATGSVSAVSGQAISTGSGDDHVINTGLVIGNIDLGSGGNTFENRAGGTFIAINTIDLTDAGNTKQAKLASPTAAVLPPNGTFSNDGQFLMGLSASRLPIDLAKGATFGNLDGNGNPATNLMYGTRVINTVNLDGNFVQSALGHMAFDVAFGPYASDKVNVSGNTTVAGKGDVVLTWLENAAPVTLFATSGTATDKGLDIRDTLALDYRVIADHDGIKLAFTSNFAQPFLNRNEREVGKHMDSAITLGGSGGIGRLMALIGNLQVGEEGTYARIFSELNPEPFLAPQMIQLAAARRFAGDLNYCDTAGSTSGHCVWARLSGSDSSREADKESFGWHGTVDSFESGFENRIDDKWSVSGAIGYDDLGRMAVGNGRAEMKGTSFHAGAGAARTFANGPKLDLSLTGGMQVIDSQRLIQVFEPAVATSSPHSSYAMAQARLSQQYDSGALFVRPAISLALTSLRQGAFTEKGAEGLGAVGVAHAQTFGTLTPDLTVGYQSRDGDGNSTALSFNIGASVHSADRLKMPFRLAGANQSADPAWISTAFDPSTFHYGANVQVIGKNDKASLNLSYGKETGKRYSNEAFSLNVRFKF